jgi:hypothetical protein
MGQVIEVDFRASRMSEREQYLHYLAVELDELDFEDFVDAVNDPAAYAMIDEDLKDLVFSAPPRLCGSSRYP